MPGFNIYGLTGPRLDAAVALAQGWKLSQAEMRWLQQDNTHGGFVASYKPSRNWYQGGVIIERMQICLLTSRTPGIVEGPWWFAAVDSEGIASGKCTGGHKPAEWQGATPLIAAMRAFVAYKLGETIELPHVFVSLEN